MRKVAPLTILSPKSERVYDVIKSPIVTEKSTEGTSLNRYSFKTAPDATKNEIKVAVETLFKVKVEVVNTLNQVGKEKRFRGIKGRQAGFKKAIVRLAQGNTIDVGAKL